MGALTRSVKKVAGVLSGCEIELLGGRSIALIDKRRKGDGWFSHRMQVKSLIESCGIDLVLDVGANIGQFARDLRRSYSGAIMSFEPVAAAYNQLAAAAGGDPNWTAHQFALGSTDAVQTIHVTGSTVFSSLLKTNEFCVRRFGDEALSTQEESVNVRRLEQVLEELVPDYSSRRVFLKLDTQGFDLEVFKGLGDKRDRVLVLQSELSLVSIYQDMPHWTDSLRAYEQAGFDVVGMFPVTRDKSRIIEYDCLLINRA